ncbi:MAG TPA: ATP-binding protein [Bacteroidia bacterium]|nr:ATP-binding protein [Bacteroidia bacterium]
MNKLADYLEFIKSNHLEEAGRFTLDEAYRMKMPLMDAFAGIPYELLLAQSIVTLTDFADSVKADTYLAKQIDRIKKWSEESTEKNEEPEALIFGAAIRPKDLIFFYAIHRKMVRRFMGRYTHEAGLSLDILQELDDLHTETQSIWLEKLFKKQEKAHEMLVYQAHMLDNAFDGVLGLDTNLNVTIWNRGAEQILGWKREEVFGKPVKKFVVRADEKEEEIKQAIRQVTKEGHWSTERDYIAKDGRIVFLLVSSVVVKDNNGHPIGYMTTFKDVTQQKNSADALQQLNKELEAFSYSVSHDLRAPLRAISGYANMLDEDYASQLDEEGKRLLGVIRYNAEKMGKLIDDLLAFSRLGRKELDRAEENMNELVEGVLIDLYKTEKSRPTIKTGNLHKAKVDYGLMHQVMFNLLSNAVKYSSKKENPLVEIYSEKKDHEIIYTVRDNGVGFDMKYAGKLFGVFQRLHSSEMFEGTGVGLAIVQRIIHKHRGRIWAEAKPGQGAAFHFSIPAQ